MARTADPAPTAPAMAAAAPRYAIYLAPPLGHALWAAGSAWLGRDARNAGDARGPARPGVAAPWRYGFHATLKPPMRLAGSADALLRDAAALATRTPAFAMPRLAVAWLDDFLALCPATAIASSHPLHRLAAECVTGLDAHRLAPSAEEQARRRPERLGPREREHLARWGYPHVLDTWRFHMTLSEGMANEPAAARQALAAEAAGHFAAALAPPWQAEALSVFVEATAGAPLLELARLPLAA